MTEQEDIKRVNKQIELLHPKPYKEIRTEQEIPDKNLQVNGLKPWSKTKALHPQMVVGMCGKKGAGKNAVARLLTAAYGFKEVSFAYHLRLELLERFPELSMDDLTSVTTKELYRPLMQWYGTEYRRNQDVEYWVNKLRPEVTALLSQGNSVVVTDVRFLNEINFVRNLGGINLWIAGDKVWSADSHSSESSITYTNATYVINNDRFDAPNTVKQLESVMGNKGYPPIGKSAGIKWIKSFNT